MREGDCLTEGERWQNIDETGDTPGQISVSEHLLFAKIAYSEPSEDLLDFDLYEEGLGPYLLLQGEYRVLGCWEREFPQTPHKNPYEVGYFIL